MASRQQLGEFHKIIIYGYEYHIQGYAIDKWLRMPLNESIHEARENVPKIVPDNIVAELCNDFPCTFMESDATDGFQHNSMDYLRFVINYIKPMYVSICIPKVYKTLIKNVKIIREWINDKTVPKCHDDAKVIINALRRASNRIGGKYNNVDYINSDIATDSVSASTAPPTYNVLVDIANNHPMNDMLLDAISKNGYNNIYLALDYAEPEAFNMLGIPLLTLPITRKEFH